MNLISNKIHHYTNKVLGVIFIEKPADLMFEKNQAKLILNVTNISETDNQLNLTNLIVVDHDANMLRVMGNSIINLKN